MPLAFTYQYNAAGGIGEIAYPSGLRVATCYDTAGQPKQVKNGATGASWAGGAKYEVNGGLKEMTLGNGVVESRQYNSRQQVSQIAATLGTPKLTLQYRYCPAEGLACGTNNGNLWSQKIDAGGTILPVSYSYDGLNRLKTMYEANSCARTYAYDRYGNRAVVQSAYWCMTQEPWTPQVSSDSPALVEAQFPKNRWTGGTNLSYDPAGNQLSVAGPKSFTYDAENRLATMTQGGTVSYAYDGEGRRVKKTAGANVTTYVYDAFGQLAAEYASPAPTSVPCTTCYLTVDHLGSTRLVTDQAGAVVERRDYFPFGEEMPVVNAVRASIAGYPGNAGQALKFTGKERDQESGLDYFGARYFSGTQGRFTGADPLLSSAHILSPQSWNRYSYALNNPLRFTDPYGLYVCNGTSAECKDFESALKDVERARNSYKKGSAQYNALNGSLQAYGKKGVDNGVTVQFGTTRSGGAGDTNIGIAIAAGTGNKMVTADNPSGQNTVVTFDLAKNIGSGLLAVSAAHEGVHVGDGTALVGALPMDLTSGAAAGVLGGAFNLTKYATEFAAYGASAFTGQGLGFGSLKVGGNFEIWNSGWKAADVNTLRSNGINGVLSDPNGLYKVTPGAPGKKLIE